MGVSFRPGDFVEGGAVPVDRHLLWEKCRFVLHTYVRKGGEVVMKRDGSGPAVTTAGVIHFKDDDGNEYDQIYSAGNPEVFIPSEDGKTLLNAKVEAAVAEGMKRETAEAQFPASLSKSSNFYLLISNVISAGFPENRIPADGDISVFDGLYAYHIGSPDPERAGLVKQQTAEGQRPKLISLPSKVIRLPGEKGKGKATTAKAATKVAEAEEEDSNDGVVEKAVEIIGKHVDEDGKAIRQSVAVAVFKDLAKDPDKDAVAGLIFGNKPEFLAALAAKGYQLVDKA